MIKPEDIGVFDYQIIPVSGLLPKIALGYFFVTLLLLCQKQKRLYILNLQAFS